MRPPHRRPARRPALLSVEELEPRRAPAVLVNAHTLTFTDVDGDKVTITASRGDLAGKATFAHVGAGQQLQVLDLTDAAFQGANLTTAVIKAATGDGLVNIGRINATGRDLGKVVVKGDLGDIDCGDSDTTTAGLKLLSVRSMGRYGLATQNFAGDLDSHIQGALGALKVAGDINEAFLFVTGNVNADGTIGSVTIGGSLVGGVNTDRGEIRSSGAIGAVAIGRDVQGGAGINSGRIISGGKLASVTIGGSLLGGAQAGSGQISAGGDLGAVRVGHDVQGGAGLSSGFIGSNGKLAGVTIGGSLLGGSGDHSGQIFSGGDLGAVKIGHDVTGGSGTDSGKLDAGGKIASILIGGSLIGSAGLNSGAVFCFLGMGPVKIGHNVQGGAGSGSGEIFSSSIPFKIASVTIGGSLIGGAGQQSGLLSSGGDMGPVKIGRDVLGGSGHFTGFIIAVTLTSVSIGGSLIGSSGADSGAVEAADLGAVTIGHDVQGGSGEASGFIFSNSKIASVTIGGSLIGGSNTSSGEIVSQSDIGPVHIGHDLLGGSITGTASLDQSGYIESVGGRIASVFIGGSIIAGSDDSTGGSLTRNASIRAGDDLGSLTVRGSLVGNAGSHGDSFVIISARGQHTPGTGSDVAIGKIAVGGRVEFAQVFAGYDTSLLAKNADAQVGAVTVGGDWAASSLIAGAVNLGADDAPGGTGANADNVNFGDLHDHKITGGTDSPGIISTIGRITIAGQVFGTPKSLAAGDRFGFVAEQIGALKIGAAAFTLKAAPNTDGLLLGRTGDIALHEIGAAFAVAPLATASAKLVNATTVTYDDVDGDHVTVKFSQPVLNAGNVNTVFKFNTGMVNDGVPARQQLQLIDLTVLGTSGLNLTVTVKPGGGDRLANIGYINATGLDLGTVSVPGDLGRIDAGDADVATPGLKALAVRSLGRLGVDTQPAASATFTPGVHSQISGGLGSLTLKQDLAGASLDVTGAIGPVTIGGSLIGGSDTDSGKIHSDGGIGVVTIGHDVQGGSGINSGLIATGGQLAGVTVGGSLIGGSQSNSGQVSSTADLGPVKVGHNVLGGSGGGSGFIGTNGKLAGIIVGGSLLSGPGSFSGGILSRLDLGPVTIGGDVVGGATAQTGFVKSTAAGITSVTVAGSLLGGAGDNSGQIANGVGGDIGPVKIGHDVQGGFGGSSGLIFGNNRITTVAIGGSLLGGAGPNSGEISSGGNIRAITIGHDLRGGAGGDSGDIDSAGKVASVIISGSVIGGSDMFSGVIHASDTIGSIAIGHDVLGGAGDTSGIIEAVTIGDVTIGGSLVGGSAAGSGAVFGGQIGPVNIGQNLIGGSISGGAASLDETGYIESSHRIANVTIGGSIIAGSDGSTGGGLTKNASIRAGDDIGAIVVKGSLIGNVTAGGASPVIISARGQASPGAVNTAIGTITIGGRVEHASIFGDYKTDLTPAGAAAQIGAVKVGQDWIASNLVDGVFNLGADNAPGGTGANADNVNFGDVHDHPVGLGPIADRIVSISIGGIVVGTDAPGDHFGFTAVGVGSFRSLGFTAPLTAGPDVIELSPTTGDVSIRDL
jgi:hypothetical protein